MINSELLKEAIADAKAVRATALANAKAALEEAFAPRFEAMFADKLKEESEEEEEGMMQEVEAPNQVSGGGGEAKGPATKPVSKGQPKTPKGGAGDTEFKAVQAGLGPKDVPKLGKKVNEAEEEDDEGKEEMDERYEEEEEEGKKMDEEFGLTQEDLDEIISELENDVAGEEEGKKVPTAPAPAPEEDPEGEPHAEPDGDEGGVPPQFQKGGEEEEEPGEVDVNAPEAGAVDINLGPEAGAEAGAVPQSGMNAGLPGEMPGQGLPGQMPGMAPQGMPGQVPPQPGDEDDENINLEELLAALNEESEEEDEGKEEMDEMENHGVPHKDQQSKATVKGYPKTGPEKTSPGSGQVAGKNHGGNKDTDGKGNIGSGPVGGLSEVAKYKVALRESYKTIEFLRGQINEVNLLNTKLIYTNKLFKEFADVLDDSYRMKIVESFDLIKSVREAKLAYALLAESLNFGTQLMRNQVKPVAKPVQTRGQVKQITEGFASKPVSSTKPSQLITESSEMALRFRKLAGIKDASVKK